MLTRPWLMFSFLLTAWVISFWPTLVEMERVWRGSDTYMHCYLVPVICAWLIWSHNLKPQLRFNFKFLLLALAFSVCWLIGYAADINTISQLAAVLVLQSLCLAWLHPTSRRQFGFAIAYLIFLVPLGDEINPQLQDITAYLTVQILQAVGIPVLREGLFLTTPIGHFEVAEACSGLRFLVASVAIGALYAHLTYKSKIRQLLFLLALVIASIFANGLRAGLLIWLAEVSDKQLGFGADHYLYGWIVFGLTMFGMFWLGSYFSQSKTNITPSDVERMSPAPQQAGIPITASCAVLVFVWLMQWPLQGTPVPSSPAPLTPPSGYQVSTSRIGTTFTNGLTHLQASSADGLEVTYATYAAKQQRGELISWDNVLFNHKLWFEQQHRQINLDDMPVSIRQIKAPTGETRYVASVFRVDGRQLTNPLHVKAWQLVSLLTFQPGVSEVLILSAPAPFDEATLMQDLQQWFQQVSPEPKS